MVSTTRCIYTCPVRLECGPDLLLKCFERSDLYYKTHEVTRCKQPLYIFMLFFIKIKLSSSLCLTHKRVTQKYRNSTLIYKKKKKRARIGSESDDTQNFLDRIGSDLKKWYRCIPNSNHLTCPLPHFESCNLIINKHVHQALVHTRGVFHCS